MMKRSEGPSITETGANTRAHALMISFMARECKHLLTGLSTRETFKMARGTGLAPSLGLMRANMTAIGSKIRNMEWESTDLPMAIFSKEPMQMAKKMASAC
jgi:hypothetical protein